MALKRDYDFHLTEAVAAIPIGQVSIVTRLTTVLDSISADWSTDCCEIGQNGTVEKWLKSAGA